MAGTASQAIGGAADQLTQTQGQQPATGGKGGSSDFSTQGGTWHGMNPNVNTGLPSRNNISYSPLGFSPELLQAQQATNTFAAPLTGSSYSSSFGSGAGSGDAFGSQSTQGVQSSPLSLAPVVDMSTMSPAAAAEALSTEGIGLGTIGAGQAADGGGTTAAMGGGFGDGSASSTSDASADADGIGGTVGSGNDGTDGDGTSGAAAGDGGGGGGGGK